MGDELLGIIIDRLDGAQLLERAADLVLAAYEGEASLDAALGGSDVERPSYRESAALAPEPEGAYLRSITVQGFRGIGEASTLPLASGPGLTIVTGRNGSGKSSFAEALEVLLTGGLRRWEGLNAVWRDGWRNLHTEGATEVSAEIHVEGTGPVEVRRVWTDGRDLSANTAWVQVSGEKRAAIESLGWDYALTDHRPFLSHAELERFFSGKPSELYELLASVLGLDDLVTMATRLAAQRIAREKALRAVKADLAPLLDDLTGLDDERAAACHQALRKREWDLDEVEGVVTGTAPADPSGDLAQLRRIAHLAAPAQEDVDRVIDRLTTAADRLEAIAGTDAGRAAALSDILRKALDHHRAHGDGPCPVCRREGALDEAWHEATNQEVQRLDQQAREATAAQQDAQTATAAVRSLVGPPPNVLPADGLVAGLDMGKARSAWETWAGLPYDDRPDQSGQPGLLRRTAEHLTSTWSPLASAVADIAAMAAVEIATREDRWGPVAARVAAWCNGARRTLAAATSVPDIRAAEAWLKDATDDIRNERLRPLAEQTKQIWSQLRQESNVELGAIRLTGSSTRRQLDIDVQVDGSSCAGLSVMSQGEVNALGLSVFLPRATMATSPFRFLVIDDPVQAMDPAKVEGLARVFGEVAKTRQVVVFTHDDRLPEAVRHLEIPAHLLEVARRPRSRLLVRQVTDPIDRALQDAAAVCADDALPGMVKARVVGPLCRTALEAAFTTMTRSRDLRKGRRRAEIEQALSDAKTLYQLAALALFGDPARTGDVLGRLGNLSPRHPDTFRMLNRSTHEPLGGDPSVLLTETRRLAGQLRQQVR